MLSSEFNAEMAALIRSLENRVRLEPVLLSAERTSARGPEYLDHLERAIVQMIALYLSLKGRPDVS